MLKRPIVKLLSLFLVLGLGLAACDSGAAPDRLTGPSQALGTSYEWDTVPLVTDVTTHGKTVIFVVGTRGGLVKNGDHWLSIPANAVTENTEFTFKVYGGKNVKVDFSAKKVRNKAPVKTFPYALTLGLSYKDAKITDPSKLYIVYIVEGMYTGLRERLPSRVIPELQIVTAPIWHFSEYEIAVD